MRIIRPLLNKAAHRVTRNANGFTLHRRFLRFFYRPVAAFFPTLDAVYEFVRQETGSDYVCIELYPAKDFGFGLTRSCQLAGVPEVNTEQTFRAIPPLPRRGPTGPGVGLLRSAVTGSGYNPNLGPGPAPSEDKSAMFVSAAWLVAAALSNDDQTPAPTATPLDTNVPLERDSSPSPSNDSPSCPSYDHGASNYDSGSSSCDSGSSSCDSGSSSCDSGSSSCDSSCGGGC